MDTYKFDNQTKIKFAFEDQFFEFDELLVWFETYSNNSVCIELYDMADGEGVTIFEQATIENQQTEDGLLAINDRFVQPLINADVIKFVEQLDGFALCKLIVEPINIEIDW